MFSKKAINLSTLKTEDKEAYDAIMAEATSNVEATYEKEDSEALKVANAELVGLRADTARTNLDAKIIKYGSALKVEDVAKEAVTEKLDFNAALIKMVDANIKGVKDIEESFEETASAPVGVSPANGDEDAPKTFIEAINMIAERDKIDVSAAKDKAMVEFKSLLTSRYEKPEAK